MIKEISSLQHPLVKHLVKLRDNKEYRYQQRHVVISGVKIITEVCRQFPAKVLLTSGDVPDISCEDLIKVPENIIRKIAGVKNPEYLIAEVSMPSVLMPIKERFDDIQYLLVLDGIADPGNMGTLLRTALALGWSGVFILENSVDPFNDKALRAAKGATFRIPMIMGGWDSLLELVAKHRLTLFLADISGEEACEMSRVALVLGSEARGASEEARKLCRSVTIPMPGDMESLNVAVAGGILMHTIKGFYGR